MATLRPTLLAAVVLAVTAGTYAGAGTVALPAGEIVFTRADPHPSLYVMATDGKGVRLLVKNAADAAVSRDGRRIAFVRDRAIWLMGRDGSGQRKLTSPGASSDSQPAWSADGGAVFFTRSTPATDLISSIFSTRSSGTGLRRLPPKDTSCAAEPAASSDGRLVAYTDYNPCDAHASPSISAVTTAGRPANLPFVFPETMVSQDPAWAPDGRRLAYVASNLEGALGRASTFPRLTGLRRRAWRRPSMPGVRLGHRTASGSPLRRAATSMTSGSCAPTGHSAER